ncbi:MAG: flagellar basal body L-ring protein FlgH, partial [Paraglaciecola sp.]|nr:flagellar basal body L-ring protein FlgH [Paraglaciecola sp.]
RDASPNSLQVPNGSLFHHSEYSGLFLQNRKYSLGDMVQVILEEETRASKRQSLSTDKEGGLSIEPLELNAGTIKVNRGDISLEHQQSSSFSSSSQSSQSNSLIGIVNVFVNEILNNGNLVVAGEKWIKLNEGDEYMRVYGELRTKDILANNTVSSTKLGNAQIEYSGKGKLQDNQKSSVIGKILSIFQ